MKYTSLPLISVIIPCFNHGLFIEDAVYSISKQSYCNIEIIIVDDGSDDLVTIEKLKSIQIKYNATVVFQKNSKTSKARNTGFKHSKGKYIMILDADDLADFTFIEKSYNIIEKYPRIGVVSSFGLCFGSENFFWLPYGGGIKNFLNDINCPAFALIRREIWVENNGFDENMLIGYEDWEFWINTTKKGHLIYIIEEFLYFYRQHGQTRAKDAFKARDSIVKYIQAKHPDVFLNCLEI